MRNLETRSARPLPGSRSGQPIGGGGRTAADVTSLLLELARGLRGLAAPGPVRFPVPATASAVAVRPRQRD